MLKPNVIILADQTLKSDLSEVFGDTKAASLMVAGSSVLEHVISELIEIKIEQCFIFTTDNAQQIYDNVQENKYCSTDLNIEVLRFKTNRDHIIQNFKELSMDNGLLIIEANKLRSFCLTQFLNLAEQSEHHLVEAFSGADKLGITLLKPCNVNLIVRPQPLFIDNVKLNLLSNCKDFLAANFDAIKGSFSGLQVKMAASNDETIHTHWDADIDKRCTLNEHVMIAKNCRVSKNTQLSNAMVNHDVYIEQSCKLDNIIVMPNSYIRKNQIINNAIVHDNTIYQLN